MENRDFLYFTSDKVLEKIDIDPRLVASFKRVLTKLQEYFNAHGYTEQRNYKDYIEKFLINNGDKNLRIYVNKLDNELIGGFYSKYYNEICINESMLSLDDETLDSTLCHEFIHFLVMHDLTKKGTEEDIYNGGFINESLTELLTQQMYPNSRGYPAQVAMQKFTNLIAGVENNYGRFLKGNIDARFCSSSWEAYRTLVNEFQKDFEKAGFFGLPTAINNKKFIEAQRSIIGLFLRPKTIDEYIDCIKKLESRPVPDNDYIENIFFPKMINSIILSTKIQNSEIKDFLKQKLVELRELLNKQNKYRGKGFYEFELEDRKLVLYEHNQLDGDLKDISRGYDPKTRTYTLTLNGKKMTLNMNEIDFLAQSRKIQEEIEQITSLFSSDLSKDLLMINSATKQDGNLKKIEKVILPNFRNVEKSGSVIYLATYDDKVVILNNSTVIGNVENISLSRYIGMTSKDPSKALILNEDLGKVEKGIEYSLLNQEQIQNYAIDIYASMIELQLTDEEIKDAIEKYRQSEDFVDATDKKIRHCAINMVAEQRFQNLTEKEKQFIYNKVYESHPTFIISSQNGEVVLSTKHGENVSYTYHSDVIFDSNNKALYNGIIDVVKTSYNSNSRNNVSSILLDENGNIIIPISDKKTESQSFSDDNPQEQVINYDNMLVNLRKQYGDIAHQIEELMKNNSVSPLPNYQEQLDILKNKRDKINEVISLIMQGQKYYQQQIDKKEQEEHEKLLTEIEEILKIKISETDGWYYDPDNKVPIEKHKDSMILRQEQDKITDALDKLYRNGSLSIVKYNAMKSAIIKEYNLMIARLPRTLRKKTHNPEAEPLDLQFSDSITRNTDFREITEKMGFNLGNLADGLFLLESTEQDLQPESLNRNIR